MINFIKEQLAVWRFKKSLHIFTQADRAFLKSARTRFITLAQQRAGVSIRAKHPRLWKYATVAVVAILSTTSGMAVFADANNAPVTSPLYNFKRISEQVRLSLSSPPQQVELHRVFANRRLEEVSELEADNDNQPIPPQSQKRIDKLNKDFENETETGLDKVQDPKVHPETRVRFCNDIIDTIRQHPQANQRPVQMMDRIKTRCNEAEKSGRKTENQED